MEVAGGTWSVPVLSRSMLSPSSVQKMESSWFRVKVGNTYRTILYITEYNDIIIIIIIIMHIVHNSFWINRLWLCNSIELSKMGDGDIVIMIMYICMQ